MWMMTPLHNPVTNAERQYQAAHTKTRCAIERAFGLLKSRFRCLDDSGGILCYSPQKVCHITVACCVLHNLCLDAGIEHEIDPAVAERIAEMAANPQALPLAGAAAARQRRLINETAWPALH
jgi:DDE superfamily endonuclease